MTGELEIRTLEAPDDMASVITVLQQVWGPQTQIANVELLRAMAHSGGYVAGAYDQDRLVGASFGFLARHHGQPALHSHVTGIVPGLQHSGLGRAIKFHQRDWAAERDLAWITWTFDPIVRRNAWFNISVLGAAIDEYLVDFYGPMNDAINRNDPSDRLLAAWPTHGSIEVVDKVPPRSQVVPTPDDIVVLRRTDPAEAATWRLRVREELGGAIAAGARVVKFTRAGEYVVAPAPE